jgi:antitoxin component YwqK of YwqJK toxin-antitoxin module
MEEYKITYYNNGNKKYEEWYKDGLYHREDGPARISYFDNGSKEYEHWYKDGKRHREDGPARISYNPDGNKNYEYWYKDGEYHREDGPSFIGYNPDGSKYYVEWCLHDQGYTKSAYNDIIELSKTIITRDAAIMNIKHPSEYIKRKCQEILNGRV